MTQAMSLLCIGLGVPVPTEGWAGTGLGECSPRAGMGTCNDVAHDWLMKQ